MEHQFYSIFYLFYFFIKEISKHVTNCFGLTQAYEVYGEMEHTDGVLAFCCPILFQH